MENIPQKPLDMICEKYQEEKHAVISMLQDIQDEFGYIPEEAVDWIAKRLDVPTSKFYGVATFYSQFYLTPRGRNIVTACSGTACHVKGSERLINGIAREIGLKEGQKTKDDLSFTLEKVNCVGACSIAPVIIINKKVHGKSTSAKILREIKKLAKAETDSKEQT